MQGGYLVTITGHTFHYIGGSHQHAEPAKWAVPSGSHPINFCGMGQCLHMPADTFHPTAVGTAMRYSDITVFMLC
jgi:hypothetical protein